MPVLGQRRPCRPDELLLYGFFIGDRDELASFDGVADIPLLLVQRIKELLVTGFSGYSFRPSGPGRWSLFGSDRSF